jgi:hypothetical protein
MRRRELAKRKRANVSATEQYATVKMALFRRSMNANRRKPCVRAVHVSPGAVQAIPAALHID